MTQKPKTCPTGSMLTYSLGECANSLVMNGIFGFAMLFYTKSLGLDPTWAGLAMSLSVFWEAVTEPVMGHISDNTRSSWGRRHPYILIGGLLMALCFYLIWTVPDFSRGSQMGIFWYLVAMNLLLRTGLTMFFIPYMALGFEMCDDYQGRSRLQGIRQIFNMAAKQTQPEHWLFRRPRRLSEIASRGHRHRAQGGRRLRCRRPNRQLARRADGLAQNQRLSLFT